MKKFEELTHMKCALHDRQISKYDGRYNTFLIHHDGNMTIDSQKENSLIPSVSKNWTEIQILLTLQISTVYYKDSLQPSN